MLHDIGAAPQNIKNTLLSFEFAGASLSLNLTQEYGAPKEQAELVYESIIRHQDLGDSGAVPGVEAMILLATIFGECSFLVAGGGFFLVFFLVFFGSFCGLCV
jgi:hypothetical protein